MAGKMGEMAGKTGGNGWENGVKIDWENVKKWLRKWEKMAWKIGRKMAGKTAKKISRKTPKKRLRKGV